MFGEATDLSGTLSSVYNELPRQTPPPMSLGARQVIADKINVPIKRLVRTQTQAG